MYQVGDLVKVTRGVHKCAFGYVSEMGDYIGQEAEITSVAADVPVRSGARANRYRIDIDDGEWSWCDACLEPVETKESKEEAERLFEEIMSIL